MHLKLTDPNMEVTIVIPESNFESAKWILFFFCPKAFLERIFTYFEKCI